MPDPIVAVLDVGKTNKKLVAYSPTLDVIESERVSIDTREWRGLEIDDTDAMLEWLRGALSKFAARYDVRAIAISGHGATFALLDDRGGLALPVISYTSERGADIQDEFYETFGDTRTLHRKTATADIGFANMAKVFHYTKTRFAEEFARVDRGVFWGPYFAHALTGNAVLEPTFPGNHTYFWDFVRGTWSDVARKLGADTLFGGEMRRPWDVAGSVSADWVKRCGLSPDCQVTAGIHDSNANLLPYLGRGDGDFVLLSTGTWNVAMRPGGATTLSDGEIANRIFFNQDAFARPVRTSLMTAGLDYDTFGEFSSLRDEQNDDALQKVFEEKDLFVIPGVMPGASAFPNATPQVVAREQHWTLDELRHGAKRFDERGQRYFAAINAGLAIATTHGLGHLGLPPGATVYIEGGFSRNQLFCKTLAALCPNLAVYTSHETEGTALGAAVTGWMLADGASLESVCARCATSYERVSPVECETLAYCERYLAFTRELATQRQKPV
jgi:L-fuculokinase